MITMGIDQSYNNSGICIFDDNDLVHAETFRSNKQNDIFQRAEEIAIHMLSVADRFKPDIIGIEGLAFGMRGDATRDLAGLQFTIINKLRFAGEYDVEVVAPNSVKKFATGDGKAKKERLFEALPLKTQNFFLELGVKKTTGLYDLTDAYWIGKNVRENGTNNK